MAKLWPLPSSTVVSARRTDRAGMRTVPLASGTLIAPGLGELAHLGPHPQVQPLGRQHRRHEGQADAERLELDGDLIVVARPTGMGNSPPARKLAVSPDWAVRFGSASTVMSWSAASASMSALMSKFDEL